MGAFYKISSKFNKIIQNFMQNIVMSKFASENNLNIA